MYQGGCKCKGQARMLGKEVLAIGQNPFEAFETYSAFHVLIEGQREFEMTITGIKWKNSECQEELPLFDIEGFTTDCEALAVKGSKAYICVVNFEPNTETAEDVAIFQAI